MSSNKGITLASLAIYIILIFIVLGILAAVTNNFNTSIKLRSDESTSFTEFDKFNMYFIQEVKKQGNNIQSITANEIVFTSGNTYVYSSTDSSIYLQEGSNRIKIAEKITKCIFSKKLENGKTIITVIIKANKSDEITNEYVLSDDCSNDSNYQNEKDYTARWRDTAKPATWSIDVRAVTDGTNVLPLPKGYKISDIEGEYTVDNGLVMKDSQNNEFIWVPVTNKFSSSYVGTETYSEPIELTAVNSSESGKVYDSQEILDYYFGIGYYNYGTQFAYALHYIEMVESVNKYGGFYIGRYETTLDENGEIGSKANKEVITTDTELPESSNKYRWYGLYNIQRNSNLIGNGDYIQTTMIWGRQWDAMLDFIGDEQANLTIDGDKSEIERSGQAIYENGEKDIINNIYDLRRNAFEFTAEGKENYGRAIRGGGAIVIGAASRRRQMVPTILMNNYIGTRLALYIK